MAEDFEISMGNRETVQGSLADVPNLPACETDEVMVQRHVGVKPRPFMADIDLAHQSRLAKHAEGVIDRVP